MINDTKKLLIVYIFVIIIALWMSGIIPKQIGKTVAVSYVEENYPERNMTFLNIDYSPIHESYFVSFKTKDGRIYNFEICPKYLPTEVSFDPFVPKG